jgi:hypothetical protein
MIKINVMNLSDRRVVRLAAKLTGCKLYSSNGAYQKFESTLANTVSAIRLVRFFRTRGYTMTSKRYVH